MVLAAETLLVFVVFLLPWIGYEEYSFVLADLHDIAENHKLCPNKDAVDVFDPPQVVREPKLPALGSTGQPF